MATPLVERILGNNSIYTNNYIDETLLLTRSIILAFHREARLYNNYLLDAYGILVDSTDKTTWRYYKHLTGEYHEVDVPMEITSWDNGSTIILDKETLNRHKTTRKELLKYGSLYSRVVRKYPEQELLVRAMINTSGYRSIQEVIDLDENTVVSYNSDLVEPVEDNLIVELEERIKLYSITRMLPQYNIADNLFLASMYHVTYNFILKTIFAIRLKNVKTKRTHSYHILSYFASHHGLDEYYRYLTKRQILFLYRNLLYLDTHAGTNDVFDRLIERLLTERNVSILNYIYKQNNEVEEDGSITYSFKQKLLNKGDLVYETRDFDFEEIREKEEGIVVGNLKEYEFHEDKIDFDLKNSLYSSLLSKDLDISLVDNTNEVRYLLLDTLTNYWAQYLNLGLMNFMLRFTDPVSGKMMNITSEQAFKLYTILLYRYNGVELETIPDHHLVRVIKPTLPENPSDVELISKFFRRSHYLDSQLRYVKDNTPSYSIVDTPHKLGEEVMEKYLYGLGTWLYLANLGDKDMNAQMYLGIENLHYNTMYKQGDVLVDDFLREIRYDEVLEYDDTSVLLVMSELLKEVSADTLGFLENVKLVHEAVIAVFSKFKSYSTQFIDGGETPDHDLASLGFPFATLGKSEYSVEDYVRVVVPYPELSSLTETISRVEFSKEIKGYIDYYSEISVDVAPSIGTDGGLLSEIEISLNVPGLVNIDNLEITNTLASQEHLLFLSVNL